MSGEGRFVNAPLPFDGQFIQVPNAWVRDARIAGNPLSILLFIRSHDMGFRLSLEYTRQKLDLGRDAFLRARRRLEECGYLVVVERRHPAGTVDPNTGKSIGGAVAGLDFRTQDPSTGALPKAAVSPGRAEPGNGKPDSGSVAPMSGENMPIATGDGKPETGLPVTGEPVPGNLRLKEHQLQEHKESLPPGRPPRNPDGEIRASSNQPPTPQKPDPELLRLHPLLDLGRVARRLAAEKVVDVAKVDLRAAAIEILGAPTRTVGDPVSYLATAVTRDPGRWPITAHLPAPSVPRGAKCLDVGHRWFGEFHELCAVCSEERPGWRTDRDGRQTDVGAA